MASNVVNLNKFRKKKQRAEKVKQADINRVRHGRTKAEKEREHADRERAARMLDGKRLESAPAIVRLAVLVKPRAKTSRIVRAEGTSIDVALAAPPVDGAANDELLRVLSAALGLPRSALSIVRGLSGRRKTVEVQGALEADVVARLAEAAGVWRF